MKYICCVSVSANILIFEKRRKFLKHDGLKLKITFLSINELDFYFHLFMANIIMTQIKQLNISIHEMHSKILSIHLMLYT